MTGTSPAPRMSFISSMPSVPGSIRSSRTVLWPQGFWSSGIPGGAARGELNGAAPSFTLDRLDRNTVYHVQAALDGSFNSGVVTATFTTPAEEPDPPTNVRIIGDTNNSLTVSWVRPSYDGGTAVTGYKVQWMTVGQSFSSSRQESVGASARTHTITGLTEGEVYFVRVVAVNAVGDSYVWSNLAYGTPGEGSGSYGVLE